MRLDKYLSLARIGTRKKVKQYIYQGDVCVNGTVVKIPAMEIEEAADKILFCGNVVDNIDKICYMFHKPQGCITAKSDENHKTVFDYFRDIDTAGLFAVGRLDRDTEGLLLVTNDGEMNHCLMDPEHHVDKTYYFWVFGTLDEKEIETVRQGVDMGAGELTKPGSLKIVRKGQYLELKSEMEKDGCFIRKRNLHRQDVSAGYLTISEGKKHQVKRMLRSLGSYVVYLKRISIGNLKLDESLKPGEYRKLDERELKWLKDCN